MRQPYLAKIIKIGAISMDLEGFCITVATVVNVPKMWLCHDALMPTLGLCVQFRQDLSKNDREVNEQRYPCLAYYDMMMSPKQHIKTLVASVAHNF